MRLQTTPHALLDPIVLRTEHAAPLGDAPTEAALLAWLQPAPPERPRVHTDARVKEAVRDLLRQGGFKPSGRSKPASEYLKAAAERAALQSINPAVDAANVVSLHAGLPISVLDADLLVEPLHLDLGRPGESYVFNPAGQALDLDGLLVLRDGHGPAGSPVKDSQRTKTHAGTRRTLTVLWGTRAVPGHTAAAAAWLRALWKAQGALVEWVRPQPPP
jgi:DNA/RNA-binding domain of Phe-tRNA-synthetase-like protein